MGEVLSWAIAEASVRTLSALTRPLLPPSHAAPRMPAMSAPSAAALGTSSAVSRPASAAVSPAACAVSTQRPIVLSLSRRNSPGPILSLVSSNTPCAPHRAAAPMTSSHCPSAYAASTMAHPGISRGVVSFTKATPAIEPSASAALTGRRPATVPMMAARVAGLTGPSAPRVGSLASMISAPPVTAAAASMASATLTNSCMLGYANICP